MELLLDLKTFKKILNKIPDEKPFLKEQTDGFKHLFETVYLPILGTLDSDLAKLNVDIGRFNFDDLVLFDDFIEKRCGNNYNSPSLQFDNVIAKLPPVYKPTVFI